MKVFLKVINIALEKLKLKFVWQAETRPFFMKSKQISMKWSDLNLLIWWGGLGDWLKERKDERKKEKKEERKKESCIRNVGGQYSQ